MADNNNRTPEDVVNDMQGGLGDEVTLRKILAELRQMNKGIDDLERAFAASGGYGDPRRSSQSNMRNMFGRSAERGNVSLRGGRTHRGRGGFVDAFEDELWKGVIGSDLKKQVGMIMSNFSKALGVSIEDIPGKVGADLGKQAAEALKNTKLGKAFSEKVQGWMNKATGWAQDRFNEGVGRYDRAHGTDYQRQYSDIFTKSKDSFDNVKNIVNQFKGASNNGSTASNFGSILGEGESVQAAEAANVGQGAMAGAAAEGGGAAAAEGAGAAAAEQGLVAVGEAAGKAIPWILIIIVVLKKLKEAMGPAIEEFKNFKETLKTTWKKDQEERTKRAELENRKLQQDWETLIKKPFQIMEDAAQRFYDVWDNNLRKINATQGYTKSDLQALMASYADRLRAEGLTNVIGSTDIITGLTQTLDAGLQGRVAEEFAYLATKLGAAIPTQDFFSYAADYATIIANATKEGKSQAEAISLANAQLEAFAGTIAYTSRQITNGVATGLKDAQSLFDDAVKIAQTAKTNNATQIANVLTLVSGVVGSIAPGLEKELTDAIVKAATGGNASELVALRSLAGINASNTEFLQMLAKNPKAVLGSVFEGLAQRQRMSDSAYMEVAEGLSSVFGVSMDALARVDFDYLARAVKSLDVNSLGALAENYEQLASGQTTTNAEMTRLAQINEYALTEGLSLVLDSEVGREIQQHMWDLERDEKMMSATFSVDLAGGANKMVNAIVNALDNVLNVLTLGMYRGVRGLINLADSVIDIGQMTSDLANILEAGQIQQLNYSEQANVLTTSMWATTHSYLGQLISTSADTYTLERDYLDQLLSVSQNSAAAELRNSRYVTGNNWWNVFGREIELLYGNSSATVNTSGTSKYRWGGIVGKSVLSQLGESVFVRSQGQQTLADATAAGLLTGAASAASTLSRAAQSVQDMVSGDVIKASYVEQGKQYSDWLADVRSKQIGDVDAVLTELGTTQEDIQKLFQQSQSERAAEEAQRRNQAEEAFWNNNNAFVDANSGIFITSADKVYDLLDGWFNGSSHNSWSSFFDSWTSYFVEHTAYNAGLDYATLTSTLNDSKRETSDAVYALSDILLGAQDIKDPQLQTNVLLSQILNILTAIMQQNMLSPSGGSSLSDTFAQLAMGITNNVGGGFTRPT